MNNQLVKKICAISLMGMLTIGMVGCGNADDSTDTTSDNVAVEGVLENDVEKVEENTEEDTEIDLDQVLQDEDSEEAIFAAAEEAAPSIDITGCDTFTQIVDQKLTAGMGYANVTIGDVDALIVCSGAYDNLDGNMAAIDGTIFIYKDGVPYEAGKVCSGGTAYPLCIKDGKLMSGSNHWVCKYLIVGDQILMIEHAAVEYDSDGNANSTYDRIDDYFDGETEGTNEEIINGLYDDMSTGEIINFDVIQ